VPPSGSQRVVRASMRAAGQVEVEGRATHVGRGEVDGLDLVEGHPDQHRGGQQVEDPCRPLDQREAALGLGAGQAAVDLGEALAGVGDPRRDQHPGGAEGVPARRPVGAGADGHGHAQLVHLDAPRPVVGAGRTGGTGHEEVVQAPAQGRGRHLGLVEGHREDLEVPPGAPVLPQRRPGRVGHRQLAGRGLHGGGDVAGRCGPAPGGPAPGRPRSHRRGGRRRGPAGRRGPRWRPPSRAAIRARRRGAMGSRVTMGSVASRSRSRNCADIRTPPSPSVIVWWRRWSMAARPPAGPR
jgi:hypothetical protein